MRLRLISAVTLVVLVGTAVVSSLVVRNLIQDQERVLLQKRAGEAASVLGSAFAGVQDSLHLLGTIAMAGQGRPSLFAAAARSVITASNEGVLVTAQRGTSMVVTAAVGDAPAAGQLIPAGQQQLGRRALSTVGEVSGVLPDAPRRWLVFAVGNAAGPGAGVWERVADLGRAS